VTAASQSAAAPGPSTAARPAAAGAIQALLWLALAAAIVIATHALRDALPWLTSYPKAWVIPVKDWISWLFDWLGYRLDFGLFAFRDITRGFSWLLGWPLHWSEALFFSGFETVGLAPLPWVVVVGLVALMGHYAGGRRTALVAGGCFLYLALFNVWQPAMETFSLVVITVPFAALTGLLLGILADRRPGLERAMTPVLDVMQSTPHFAYLVPVVVLFGFGQVPAMIATAIFAVPPMVRCTLLGLRTVSPEIMEAGRMAGCTPRQLLWKAEIPAARPTVMVGVNQVIMQTLAMAVIASLIGASGLGQNLLRSLDTLRLGKALEQGVAIVVIAVALDRLGQAYAQMKPMHQDRTQPYLRRHPHLCLAIAIAVVGTALAMAWDGFRVPPEDWTVSTAPVWDGLVDWISTVLYEPLQGFRNFLLLNILIPWRNAFQWLPWTSVVAGLAILGYRVGGARLALTVGLLMLFPAVTGFWVPAMITAYMIGSAVVLCILLGFPIGLWASRSDRAAAWVMTLCDTLQTFPSFIYLIPVVMLFKVGDVAAIMAVIAYAVVPMIRYTNVGLRGVPHQTREAATASGCTKRQSLWKVELPVAFPHIMLGVNQTIMMGLFMVAITALIGTKDLGQEINRARSDADPGRALVAGFCIAFLGIMADRIIGTWSRRRRQQLGLD
jgi:glycine betaine/proline transport system permease protein